MKFVALVSGGKDSCFNILHCLNAGHELVAMANLHPKADRPDEIDSWMFQTVGHQAVELLAQCAEVPLFRSEISENEDAVVDELAALFTRIRSEVDFEAVSVGAIASTYQQLRVDRACARLNLRALSYLWQRDQRDLLKEINRSGMDVRVIKVAGQSLGQQHLGRTLADIESDLLEKNEAFGLHPCGEGGEYETMVFDTSFFPRYRMAMKNPEIVHHSTDDVYYLNFSVTKEDKEPTSGRIDVPPLLEPRFKQLLEVTPAAAQPASFDKGLPTTAELGPKVLSATFQGSFESCFAELDKFFMQKPDGLRLAFHVVVLLKDMTRFGKLNALYSSVFSKAVTSLSDGVAPSRACVQASIPYDAEVTVFYTSEIDRSSKGIHVQGLSYWAPASIGPYSQCRLVNGISCVAGQIGLIPQSLNLEADREIQALLALQHAVRVLNVIHEQGSNWTPRLAIAWITDAANQSLVQSIWERYCTSIPLIAVVVEGLPRGAQFEWSIQGCDSRYFAWYIPENDDEDDLYSPKPEVLRRNASGYCHRAGFQTLDVGAKPLNSFQVLFSCSDQERPLPAGANKTPTQKIFFDGVEVNELYIDM